MDVSFCKSCDNLLYLYIDDEENELYNCCKSCGSKEKLNKDLQLVYNNDNQISYFVNVIYAYHILI